MCSYGFEENKSYFSFLGNRSDGKSGKPKKEHILTLDMAEHIAMIQRTPQGFEIRQKLIELNRKVNENKQNIPQDLPTALRAYAEEIEKNQKLLKENTHQKEEIKILKPKAEYTDNVLNSKQLLTVTSIAKDFGKSPQWLNKLKKK